jgi:hypothetical protein
MMPAYAVLIVLAFVFGPLVSVELGDWLFGNPLTGGPILLGLIVLAMVIGGWRELTGR